MFLHSNPGVRVGECFYMIFVIMPKPLIVSSLLGDVFIFEKFHYVYLCVYNDALLPGQKLFFVYY